MGFLLATLVLVDICGLTLAADGQSSKVGRSDADKSKQKKQAADEADKTSDPPEKVVKSAKEWREILSREQFKVLRQKATERPFKNKYDRHFEPGTYACAACGQELFSSDTKFNSGCGWPAFFASKAGDRVKLAPDLSLGMVRTEVMCARCDSHLGHLFEDAPQTPTGQRFCINSVALKFIPAKTEQKPADESGGKEKKKKDRD